MIALVSVNIYVNKDRLFFWLALLVVNPVRVRDKEKLLACSVLV